MIYLIGGAPRCGKSILSERIAAQKGISWISTDTIDAMIMACTPKAQRDKKFPYGEFQRGKEPYADLVENSPDVLLNAEITEAASVWPSIQAMIKQLIECGQSYIIEGVHLMPEHVEALRSEPFWEQIRLVYLVKTNLQEIKDGFIRNTSEHDWLSGAVSNPVLLDAAARMVQTKSLYVEEQAAKYGFAVVDTGKDFEGKIAKLVQDF